MIHSRHIHRQPTTKCEELENVVQDFSLIQKIATPDIKTKPPLIKNLGLSLSTNSYLTIQHGLLFSKCDTKDLKFIHKSTSILAQ